MTEFHGPGPDEPTFSHDELGDPPVQAEINAELDPEAVLENAKPYFQRLLAELQEPLSRGAYTTILGDDVTGRIPALVIGEVAKKFADKKGRAHPNQAFFVGGGPGVPDLTEIAKLAMELETGEPKYTPSGIRKLELDPADRDAHRDRLLSDYVEKLKPRLGKRVLVATDRISSGHTIDRIAAVLHAKGIDFDIATLGSWGDLQAFIDERRARPEFASVNWFTGGDQTEDGILISRHDQLYENQWRQAIGTEKNWLQPTAVRGHNFDGARVSAARDSLSAYCDDLYRGLTAGR